MIVQTRYRDIPYEEAIKCCNPRHIALSPEGWRAYRGQPVRICVPASNMRSDAWACEGPVYTNADQPDRGVCPHIAEIGD